MLDDYASDGQIKRILVADIEDYKAKIRVMEGELIEYQAKEPCEACKDGAVIKWHREGEYYPFRADYCPNCGRKLPEAPEDGA
jgi:hypothetical protein